MTADSPEADEYNYHDEYWRCGRADKCAQTAGWGTDHVGVGACKLHGGNAGAPSGPENGQFKHGLYSDVIREEDRATLDAIEELDTAEKLESTLNMQVMKLRRAIAGMEDEDRASFLDVFEDMVQASTAPDDELNADQLRSLAKMLGQNDRAIREWMDLIRRTAKDLDKITEGEDVNVNHGVDSEEMDELKEMADGLF